MSAAVTLLRRIPLALAGLLVLALVFGGVRQAEATCGDYLAMPHTGVSDFAPPASLPTKRPACHGHQCGRDQSLPAPPLSSRVVKPVEKQLVIAADTAGQSSYLAWRLAAEALLSPGFEIANEILRPPRPTDAYRLC